MTTMTDLELRYDGAIPARELAAVQAGGIENLERKEAADAVWFMRDEVRFFVGAIRSATTASHAATLRQDLRATWARYRQAVARLRSLQGGDTPAFSQAA